LYQKLWNADLGIKVGKEEKRVIEQLKDINFLDKTNEKENLKQFVQVMKDYTPKDKNKKDKKKDSTDNGSGGDGHDGLKIFSDNQIMEGIKQFSNECTNPSEFEKIVQEVLSEGQKKDSKIDTITSSSTTRLSSAGIDKGITLLANNFYTALAEKYSIPIRKKPSHKNGSLFPHSHSSFSIGDSISDLDPFSSPGILPGVTKKWVRQEGEFSNNYETVPNNIIIIDNSPSMFQKNGNSSVMSPSEKIYLHIVGATAISNAYLDNSGKVAVYSFGSSDYFTALSKNKSDIHTALRRYSVNGGTTFNEKFLTSVLKDNPEEFDITVVSDMDISNLQNFVNTVINIPKTHRVHLLYTNNEYISKVNTLKNAFKNKDNVATLPLIYDADIKRIVMGELKKSVH
jgi:hypothetical protein